MTKCLNCGCSNLNSHYCQGCGEALTKEKSFVSSTPSASVSFLDEVIGTIENIFPEEEKEEDTYVAQPVFDIAQIVNDQGIHIIDDQRWKNADIKECFFAFSIDMTITILFSAFSAVLALFIANFSILMSIKIYFVIYALLSFVSWFLFPFVLESSPYALSYYNLTIVKGAVKRIKKEYSTFLILWILSLIYAFFPVLIIESVTFLLRKKNRSMPFIFQLIGIKYMKRMD